MKRFLFMLVAAGGLLLLTAGTASAGHWRGGRVHHRHVHGPWGPRIGYGYHRHRYPARYAWGYRAPVRRSFGISIGYGPGVYGGYYGGGYGGYYGGGYYGGNCAY